MRFVIEPMRLEHIPAVGAIERQSFTQPWPANAYRKELQESASKTYYVVARRVDDAPEPAPVAVAAPAPGAAEAAGDSFLARLARLIRPQPEPPALEAELRSIVGYAGLWLMVDEAHITTIAVAPAARGQGVGELLLLALIDRAIAVGARWVTLEVRVSNQVAQSLYRKYTFKEMGVRKRYYSDNNEDALIMWTEPLDSPEFRRVLEENRRRLAERLARAENGRRCAEREPPLLDPR